MTHVLVPPEEELTPPAQAAGAPEESWLVLGRPIEDRSFEAVEAGMGVVAGLVIGSVVAGPIGTAIGGVVGAAAGIMAGEAVERIVGDAATTTDATHGERDTR